MYFLDSPARARRVAISVTTLATTTFVAILEASCTAPSYFRSDDVQISFRLDGTETNETLHVTYRIHTDDEDLPAVGRGSATVTVCRIDGAALSPGIARLLVVADAPSTGSVTSELDVGVPCASISLDFEACEVLRESGTEARCGVTISLEREDEEGEVPSLEVIGDLSFAIHGDADAPDDLVSETWVDD